MFFKIECERKYLQCIATGGDQLNFINFSKTLNMNLNML